MPKGVGIDFGWCGFGHHSGPPRTFRLGFLSVMLFPDGIVARFASYEIALQVKREEQRK